MTRGQVAQSSTARRWQDYGGVLHAEGALAGLSWADAKQIAAAVPFDMCTRDDAEPFVRGHARNMLAGVDNMPWEDRVGAARAMTAVDVGERPRHYKDDDLADLAGHTRGCWLSGSTIKGWKSIPRRHQAGPVTAHCRALRHRRVPA